MPGMTWKERRGPFSLRLLSTGKQKYCHHDYIIMLTHLILTQEYAKRSQPPWVPPAQKRLLLGLEIMSFQLSLHHEWKADFFICYGQCGTEGTGRRQCDQTSVVFGCMSAFSLSLGERVARDIKLEPNRVYAYRKNKSIPRKFISRGAKY